ncbi:MAG: hypothetical protein ACK4FR_08300 [Tabrizicola sp.]
MRTIAADRDASMAVPRPAPAPAQPGFARGGTRPGPGTGSLDTLVNALDRAVARSAMAGQTGHACKSQPD